GVPMLSKLLTAKLVATVAGTVGMSGALAATGSLPAPVQSAASHALDGVGIDVPAPSRGVPAPGGRHAEHSAARPDGPAHGPAAGPSTTAGTAAAGPRRRGGPSMLPFRPPGRLSHRARRPWRRPALPTTLPRRATTNRTATTGPTRGRATAAAGTTADSGRRP